MFFFDAGLTAAAKKPAKKPASAASAAKKTAKKPAKKAAPKAGDKKKAVKSKPKAQRGGADPTEMQQFFDTNPQDAPQAGGGAFSQSLANIAIPFGLVLAKNGLQAWRMKKADKASAEKPVKKASSTKTSGTKKASTSTKKTTSTRKRVAVGGADAELNQSFGKVLENIARLANSRS